MANRHTLHYTHLEDFKRYLQKKGYEIKESKGVYEALRAIHENRKHPVIIYRRLDNSNGTKLVHLTVMDRDEKIVKGFYKERQADND